MKARDQQACDSREIGSLHCRVRELQQRVDLLESDNRTNLEQTTQTQKEAYYWKEMAETFQRENKEARQRMEDLETKNRLLVEKLNAQIYLQASVYKEKTMNALMRSSKNESSQSPHRSSMKVQHGCHLTSNHLGSSGPNESAFARSPLDMKRVIIQPPALQAEHSMKEKSYSPLRKSRSPARRGLSNSPSRVAAAL